MITVADVILTMVYFISLFYAVFWLITLIGMSEEEKKNPRIYPKVTVAIPAYNEEANITKAMKSVCALHYPKEKLELIVINDGSRDQTKEIVERFIAQHKTHRILLINQENHGKYYALNAAIKKSRGELFAGLDADSFIDPDALQIMIPCFEDKKTAVVLPLMKIASTKNMFQKLQWYEYLINMFYKRMMSYLNCIHVTPGPFSLYRKSVFRIVGGFRKGHNTEDLEMALRIQKHQYKIVQLMDAVVYTIPPDNFKDLYQQRNRWNRGSILNVWDYRSLIFNKKYGDFGFFQLPFVFTGGIIALVLIFSILYYSLLKPAYLGILRMNAVGFDLLTLLRNFKFDILFLDFDYFKAIIIISTLAISLIVLFATQKYTKEKFTKHGIIPLLVFIFSYYVLLGIIWLGIAKDLIFKRKKSYGKWHEK